MNRISVFYEHMAEAMKQENIALDEVCAAVKRFGFDGVELDANRIKNEGDIILPALQKSGLCVNGIYNFFDFGSETGSPENDRAESLRVIDCCEKANCKFLLAVAGFLTEDEMVQSMRATAEIAVPMPNIPEMDVMWTVVSDLLTDVNLSGRDVRESFDDALAQAQNLIANMQ